MEFSMLARSGVQLNEAWLYIFDALPTFIGVLAFAIVLPYDLPHGRMFREGAKRRRRWCRRTDTEDGTQVITEPEITKDGPEVEVESIVST
jgi:hypothetical protein